MVAFLKLLELLPMNAGKWIQCRGVIGVKSRVDGSFVVLFLPVIVSFLLPSRSVTSLSLTSLSFTSVDISYFIGSFISVNADIVGFKLVLKLGLYTGEKLLILYRFIRGELRGDALGVILGDTRAVTLGEHRGENLTELPIVISCDLMCALRFVV